MNGNQNCCPFWGNPLTFEAVVVAISFSNVLHTYPSHKSRFCQLVCCEMPAARTDVTSGQSPRLFTLHLLHPSHPECLRPMYFQPRPPNPFSRNSSSLQLGRGPLASSFGPLGSLKWMLVGTPGYTGNNYGVSRYERTRCHRTLEVVCSGLSEGP